MKVVAVDGNSLTVLRAQLGTKATVHADGVVVARVTSSFVIARSLLTVSRAQANTTAAAHADRSAVKNVLPLLDSFGSGSQALFAGFGEWAQKEGQIVLSLLQTIKAGRPFSFQVQLRNSERYAGGQLAVIMATVKGAYAITPGVLNDGALFLEVRAPGFADKLISQNQSSPSLPNTLSVTLSPNHILSAPASITIDGLTGTGTNDTTVSIMQTGSKLAGSGTWDKSLGKLVVPLANAESLFPDVNYSFSFVLVNPSVAQPSPAISISGSSSVMGGIVFAAEAMQKLPTMLGYGRYAAPLHITSAHFLLVL